MKTFEDTAYQQAPQTKIYDENKPKVILRKSGIKIEKKPTVIKTRYNLFK